MEDASLFCLSQPHCTLFIRKPRTGETWFCQGYSVVQNSKHVESPDMVDWVQHTVVSAIRSGCEHYVWAVSRSEILAGQAPVCVRKNQFMNQVRSGLGFRV